jgi:hypothetical protein
VLRPDVVLGFCVGVVWEQDLQDYFDNTWTMTEVLFSALQGEEPFFRPPYHELRHPLCVSCDSLGCMYQDAYTYQTLLLRRPLKDPMCHQGHVLSRIRSLCFALASSASV